MRRADEGTPNLKVSLRMPPRVPDEHLDFARKLRRDMTIAEAGLWRALRGRGVGAKFRRQVPIGAYVADFACTEARLIVELDGAPHDTPEQTLHDQERDAWFTQHGWRILRFPNDFVLGGGDLILDRIRAVLRESPHPTLADARATFSRGTGEGEAAAETR